MTDLDPLLDPTGRIEPVQNAIIGGRSLWEDARARLFERGGSRALEKGMVDGISALLILEAWMESQYGD